MLKKMLILYSTEPRIPLYFPCSPGELCADLQAECTGGQCDCKPRYYDEGGACGQYQRITSALIFFSCSLHNEYCRKTN